MISGTVMIRLGILYESFIPKAELHELPRLRRYIHDMHVSTRLNCKQLDGTSADESKPNTRAILVTLRSSTSLDYILAEQRVWPGSVVITAITIMIIIVCKIWPAELHQL